MSRNLPPFPTEITLETLPQLFAAHRARFGGMTMEGPDEPTRPEDVSEEVWDALGDAGKQAIQRERDKNAQLTRDLAAARARPAPPKTPPATPPAPPQPTQPAGDDLAAQIKAAVAEAVAPLQEAQQKRDATEAARKIADAVQAAAADVLHDKTDALQIDLTTVVDDNGQADQQKIQDQLTKLVQAKPHLAKTDGRRYPQHDSFGGAGGNTPPLADRVKSELAVMQQATGIRPPT